MSYAGINEINKTVTIEGIQYTLKGRRKDQASAIPSANYSKQAAEKLNKVLTRGTSFGSLGFRGMSASNYEVVKGPGGRLTARDNGCIKGCNLLVTEIWVTIGKFSWAAGILYYSGEPVGFILDKSSYCVIEPCLRTEGHFNGLALKS